MIKVIIIDEQKLFSYSLKAMLEQDYAIKVCGTYINFDEALNSVAVDLPDVIISEVKVHDKTLLSYSKRLNSAKSNPAILILSSTIDQNLINEALLKEIYGFIPKTASKEELVYAIMSLAQGDGYLYKSYVKLLAKVEPIFRSKNKINLSTDLIDGLTSNEKKILKNIIQGFSNKEIARNLNLAEGTIKNYVSVLLNKFNLNDRTQLAIYAFRSNLFETLTASD